MTTPFFPGSYGSPFDDFFARYLGGEQREPSAEPSDAPTPLGREV